MNSVIDKLACTGEAIVICHEVSERKQQEQQELQKPVLVRLFCGLHNVKGEVPGGCLYLAEVGKIWCDQYFLRNGKEIP